MANFKENSINSIAKKNGIGPNSLARALEKTNGDIDKALEICRMNKEKKKQSIVYYKYNGEDKTANQIAELEKIDSNSLRNQLKKTQDIYEAVRICKENKQKRNKDRDSGHENEDLTIKEIAKREKIDRNILAKALKETQGDLDEAIRICKENQTKKNGTIPYEGTLQTINAIAKKEGIGQTSLANAYKKTNGDIIEAVAICKRNQERLKGTIPYEGQMMTLRAIAEKEKIIEGTLHTAFKKTGGDIDEAIRICNESKDRRIGKIPYEDGMTTINELAKRIDVSYITLKRWYEKTNNIYKAVFICQSKKTSRERKNMKINTSKYGDITYYDLSLILGIKYGELKNLLDKGYTADQIANMNLKPTVHKSVSGKVLTKLPNGQSLREYCVENKLNYTCIYRAINTYGKSLESAVDFYKKYGQQIPTKWIYEKYGLLLKHLLLKDGIDVKNVVEYMRSDLVSLDEAVENCIVRKNAKKDGLNEEWMTELYDVLTDKNIANEYDEYLKTFYVDDKEEECVIKSYDEVENFKRQELLFEISQALNEGLFKPEEEAELLKQYDIKPREIETMFLELYDRFEEPGVLRGEDMHIERTPEEMEKINEKIQKYQQMIQDRQVISVMRTSVNEKVGENKKTRQELNTRLKEKQDRNKLHN